MTDRKPPPPASRAGSSRAARHRPVEMKRVYTPADLENVPHLASLPGQAPFVRGPYATMYTQKPWTIRQYAGYADAADSNLAFRTALERGAQGLSVAFDLPTQRGYDSTDAEALADVGMAGVAIDTADDMARLFKDIPLDRVSVSMTMNGAVLPVLAAFIVAAEESGVALRSLSGTIQNDILKEFMVRNAYIHAPEPSMRIVGDVVHFLSERAPRFRPLSVSGYHFQEGGADAVLELALTFANAREYVRTLQGRGLNAEHVCEQFSFFFGVGTDFFVEIAKLRAARIIWSGIAGEAGARSDASRALRMHCQTSGWSLSARQPDNNIVRTTVEAMAAVFGGTQSLHTNAFDEALALPSPEAARLARDTQLVLQHEMGLCDVVDPWAGSYMMESLTSELVERTRGLLDEIEAQGGVLDAIRSGWVQHRIRTCAVATQARIDAGEQVIVGANAFVSPDAADETPPCFEIDAGRVRAQQAARLNDVKARRDGARVESALARLARAARDGSENLLAVAIECMRLRATVGECTRALETVWPRHVPSGRTICGGYAMRLMHDQSWDAACDKVRGLTSVLGRKPRVLLAKLGQDGHDRGIAVVAAALSDAGFHVLPGELFACAADTAARAIEEGCDVVGVSSLAGAHLALVPQLAQELAARRTSIDVVAGGIIPDPHVPLLRARGVADVFGPGVALHAIVDRLVRLIERRRARTGEPGAREQAVEIAARA